MSITAADLLANMSPDDPRRALLEPPVVAKRRAKYGNHKVRVDGWLFDSKREAARYDQLKLLKQSGAVRWFAIQCPFLLAGGIVYRADFIVCWGDGNVTVEDVKGMKTKEYRIKRRLMCDAGVTIVEVR